MALPSIAKNWQILPNQSLAAQATVLAQARDMLLAFKTALMGGHSGWYDTDGNSVLATTGGATHVASCNSSTVSTVSDLCTSTSSFVWSGASAFSWFIVSCPGIAPDFQLYIGCKSVSEWDLEMYAFPTGYDVIGTTTARPTATDEVAIMTAGSPRWGAPSSIQKSTRWHFWLATDGSGFRMVQTRKSFENIWFELQSIVDAPDGITNAWAATYYGSGDRVNPGDSTINTLQNHSQAARFKTRVGSTNINIMLSFAGIWGGYLPHKSNITNKWQLVPVSFVSIVANNEGPLGTLADVYLFNSGSVTPYFYTTAGGGGNGITLGTNAEFAAFGAFAYPWCRMQALVRNV